MAIIERVESREETVSVKDPSAKLLYTVTGTEDEAAVKTLVGAAAPATYNGLFYQSYRIRHLGGGVWEVEVAYGKQDPLEFEYTFETSGGKQKVTQSLRTVNAYGVPGDSAPPDYLGAIGVGKDGVEGCEVTTPVFNFTETHRVPVASMDTAYKLVLFGLTGRVNDATFKGFAAGEVLFLGASAQISSPDYWTVKYSFAALPNAVNLLVGEIGADNTKAAGVAFARGDPVYWHTPPGEATSDPAGGANALVGRAAKAAAAGDAQVRISDVGKKGWEYLWVRYQDAEDSNCLVKQPAACYVEQVYEEGDFSLLGIGA